MIYYYVISLVLGGVAALVSGLFVLLRNGRQPVNRAWFLVSLCSSCWSFGYMFMITASTPQAAWYANWFLHAGAIMLPSFFFHFVLMLTKQDKDKKARIVL
ncbi:hypothetical protein HGA64_00060 [Candidatus Falkowbacteria bacterium]|nr:hypothetical protein [Candidatus Falkowbacteria bacterium]